MHRTLLNEAIAVAPALIEVAILDDDVGFRPCIDDLLRDEPGYAVRTFARPDELFAAAEARPPDILLLDMKMSAATGDNVVQQLLSHWPELCIIVVTDYPSYEDMRAIFDLRVFACLAKPFSLIQLRQTLQNAIEQFSLGRTAQDRLPERLGHRIKLLRVERGSSLNDRLPRRGLAFPRSAPSSVERIFPASKACVPSAVPSNGSPQKHFHLSASDEL